MKNGASRTERPANERLVEAYRVEAQRLLNLPDELRESIRALRVLLEKELELLSAAALTLEAIVIEQPKMEASVVQDLRAVHGWLKEIAATKARFIDMVAPMESSG